MITLSGAFQNALNRPVDSIRTTAALVLAGAETAAQFPKIEAAARLTAFFMTAIGIIVNKTNKNITLFARNSV